MVPASPLVLGASQHTPSTSLHMNTNLAEFSSDLRFTILADNLEFSSVVGENVPDFSVQKYWEGTQWREQVKMNRPGVGWCVSLN